MTDKLPDGLPPTTYQREPVSEVVNNQPKLGRFMQAMVRGASIQINPDKQGANELAKSSIKFRVFYIPRLKFWTAPDVKLVYRAFCRSVLKIAGPRDDRFEDFTELCRERKIGKTQLTKIEKGLKTTALLCLMFFVITLLMVAYIWTLPVFLTGSGAAFISLSLYWKYSFRLWQVRLRSLDPVKASPKAFMKGDWYLEAIK